MFLIPLAIVMLMQAFAAYGTLWLGGTARRLDDYSVGIMGQIVKNRNLILENNMIHRWSEIDGECQTANAYLSQLLSEKGLDEQSFLADEQMKQELLGQMLTPSLNMLRRNGVNGVYVILADGLQDGPQDVEAGNTDAEDREKQNTYRCSGFYFRDSDANVNPKDYSDLLMERGEYEFSHALNIPFDTVWTTKFNFSEEGILAADDFFYKPYRAALDNPGAVTMDLGYWSKMFCLEGNEESDGYRMLSYSMPLVTDRGQVYGVLGIELSLSAIEALLPQNELNLGKQSGYMVAEYDNNGNLVPFLARGSAVKRNVALNQPLTLLPTSYETLYELGGNEEENSTFYANIMPFSMYNSNTPFIENGWALVGVQDKEGLFGLGNRIMKNVLLALLVTLLLGFACIYALMNHIIGPISELAGWIRNDKKIPLREYKDTGIAEIDALYDAVSDLTEKQKKAESIAVEEKERYFLALQSSTDIIYTYNIAEDTMDIFNITSEQAEGEMEKHEICVMEGFRNSKILYDADRRLMERMFACPDDKFKMHFRARSAYRGFRWMELSGKTIYDESGKKIKVIGSIRDIHEQKVKEKLENRAAQIDPVTGLYREEIGRKIINAEAWNGRGGHLVLMDIDKFKELDEQYGIDFGDAVLEEIGSYIMKLKQELKGMRRRLVPVRVGGDEILLWLQGFSKKETEDLLTRFYKMVRQLYQDGDFEISITAAALPVPETGADLSELTGRLCAALFYCKKRNTGRLTFSDEIPETELLSEHGEKRSFNEIASVGSSRSLNMVTKAFNLFERGGRVAPIISVLFAKIGDNYKVRDILMTEIRWDFNATGVFTQWHAAEDAIPDTQIHRFLEEEMEACAEKLSGGALYFEADHGFTEEEKRLLHIPDGLSGFCVPLYDSRKLVSVISFLHRPEREPLSGGERSELLEIVRIIETNVNRERYDLASRAKSDFLSRMSHEIRTPMNAIIGMTAIALEKREERGTVESCLYKINQSSHYLLGLINDILDMSKIESGKMKLSLMDGSLGELADDIADLMGPQIDEKQINYVEEFHLTNQWIHADFMRLKQVIINLMGNAVKFTPEGGTIKFIMEEKERGGSSAQETELYFAVTDTGIGIGREHMDRIFDAFEQAENATAASYGGTGLGLSISARLVRMMGGDIGLESEEGVGSSFHFTLRLRTARARKAEEKEAAGLELYDFTDCKVLLVEDNALNTEIAKALLEMHGLFVETAENGLLGAKAFENSPAGYFDLILMDIRMPVMDGLEAAKTIRHMDRADAATVPIIAMTANAFDEDMKKSIESGMNGHLAKPVDVNELIKAVGMSIKKSKKK